MKDVVTVSLPGFMDSPAMKNLLCFSENFTISMLLYSLIDFHCIRIKFSLLTLKLKDIQVVFILTMNRMTMNLAEQVLMEE